MHRSPLCLVAIGCLLSFGVGCQGHHTPVEATIKGIPEGLISSTRHVGDEYLLGTFRVLIDPVALTARVIPTVDRHGTAQGDVDDFDAWTYLSVLTLPEEVDPADLFAVESVSFNDAGEPILEWVHKHPWPGPSLTGDPNSYSNRADYGYTGRVVFLADPEWSEPEEAAHTYFGGDVKAHTDLLANPDGYINLRDTEAGDWIVGPSDGTGEVPFSGSAPNHVPALVANTFPYQLLADEHLSNDTGNRFDAEDEPISNGGDPWGNYTPGGGVGGWQRSNLTRPNGKKDGWTGYDYVHQGQRVRGTAHFNRDFLVQGQSYGVEVGVAIIVKYTNPKREVDPEAEPEEENWHFWLPRQPVDPTAFAYRLPHAALDQSKVEIAGPIYLDGVVEDESDPFDILVRDWDAGADEVEYRELDFALNGIGEVAEGTSGSINPVIDCPAILSDPATVTDTPSGTGFSDAPLSYEATITNELGVTGGEYTALVRLEDPWPEYVFPGVYPDDAHLHVGVDPESATRTEDYRLRPVTYGAFTVVVRPTAPGWSDGDIPDALSSENYGNWNSVTVIPDSALGNGGTAFVVYFDKRSEVLGSAYTGGDDVSWSLGGTIDDGTDELPTEVFVGRGASVVANDEQITVSYLAEEGVGDEPRLLKIASAPTDSLLSDDWETIGTRAAIVKGDNETNVGYTATSLVTYFNNETDYLAYAMGYVYDNTAYCAWTNDSFTAGSPASDLLWDTIQIDNTYNSGAYIDVAALTDSTNTFLAATYAVPSEELGLSSGDLYFAQTEHPVTDSGLDPTWVVEAVAATSLDEGRFPSLACIPRLNSGGEFVEASAIILSYQMTGDLDDPTLQVAINPAAFSAEWQSYSLLDDPWMLPNPINLKTDQIRPFDLQWIDGRLASPYYDPEGLTLGIARACRPFPESPDDWVLDAGPSPGATAFDIGAGPFASLAWRPDDSIVIAFTDQTALDPLFELAYAEAAGNF